MKCGRHKKLIGFKRFQHLAGAFTLVELLVVISIIALLLAILMPSLGKARYMAQRVYCSSNVRSQYYAQILYATDNDGKFAVHTDFTPHYVRSNGNVNNVHQSMYPYIKDSKILLCPILSRFGYEWQTTDWPVRPNPYSGDRKSVV